ncbi:hypothetical protein [Sorangium sp. So ce1153]|uniref:hypothetical protein n=1 Tax=Sorangium sp. So ce1153 TaxID=3133333 RepID=UPI003F5FD306
MPKLSQKFASRGWTFDYDMLARGGLVLGNVRHEQYNFARDFRVVRIWVNPDEPWSTTEQTGTLTTTKGKKDVKGVGTQFNVLRPGQQISNDAAKTFYTIASIQSPTRMSLTTGAKVGISAAYVSRLRRDFYLGTEDFDVEPPEADGTYERRMKLDAPPPFDIYTHAKRDRKASAGLMARYKSKHKVFGFDDDEEDDHLVIEQSYVLASYGIDPPHEPGALLPAARLFPLIKFIYKGNKVKTIRIDYRMEFGLDRFLLRLEGRTPGSSPSMLAGVFRDTERAPSGAELEDLFEALEKPVLYELFGRGLVNGKPGIPSLPRPGSPLIPTTWDNFHFWSSPPRDAQDLKKLPSTPGAFHAVHMHWRWGDFVASPTFFDFLKVIGGRVYQTGDLRLTTGAIGAGHLKGIQVAEGIGGPLLDPQIPTQTIRFAITKATDPDYENAPDANTPDLWNADECPSERVYGNLFLSPAGRATEPRYISKGEHLVTWYSVEVHAKSAAEKGQEAFSGTVLIHGLYFAHEEEPPSNVHPFHNTIGVGAQIPKYTDPVPWLRSPIGK